MQTSSGKPPVVSGYEAVGLWRDDLQLVVVRHQHRFPARCIKSNSTSEVAWHAVNASNIPDNALINGFGITMGALGGPVSLVRAAVAIGENRASDRLEIPLSTTWRRRWQGKSVKGWTLVLGGGLLFVGSVVAYMACMFAAVPEWIANWLLLPLALGPPVALGGAIYLISAHEPIVTVKRMTPEFLWLGGVHHELLATLPDWKSRNSGRAESG